MRKLLEITGAVAMAACASGCTVMLAGAAAVGTPDEIKRSGYTSRLASTKPIAAVSGCLKGSLAQAKSGSRPAQFTYRDAGTEPYQFVVSNNVPSTWSGARPEILALVETYSAGGGSVTQVWAHPRLLSDGGSRGYLDRTLALVQPCMS